MNRWLKYGGIMPETVNISGIEIIQNSSYFDSGNPGAANNYQRINSYIPLTPGTYELKFITVGTETSTNILLRIIGYDGNKDLIGIINKLRTWPVTSIDKILKYKVIITNQKYIRMSYRMSLQLMEIEKL